MRTFYRFATFTVMLGSLCGIGQMAFGQTTSDVPGLTSSQNTPAAAVAQPTPLTQARGLLTATDYTGADRFLRQLLTQQPKLAEAHFLLAFALLHEKKPTEALAEYTLGAKSQEWRAEELTGVASAYLQLQRFAEAEIVLADATKLAPERPLLWYLLGRAQYEQNHPADAERSLLTCLRLKPQNVRAEALLGLAYEALQRPGSAAAAYREAIALQETASIKEAQPYLSLGMILRRQGNTAEALPLLTTAVSLVPGNALSRQELALAKEQLGQYEEALAAMKTAVALSPKQAETHFFLGRLYRQTGHQQEAAAEFREAARLASQQKDAVALGLKGVAALGENGGR